MTNKQTREDLIKFAILVIMLKVMLGEGIASGIHHYTTVLQAGLL